MTNNVASLLTTGNNTFEPSEVAGRKLVPPVPNPKPVNPEKTPTNTLQRRSKIICKQCAGFGT